MALQTQQRVELYKSAIAAINGACATQGDAHKTAALQRLAPIAQLIALAKGLIAPEDLRIGGTLRPEESASIISMVTADDFLSKITTDPMHRNTKDGRVLDLAPRQLKRVAQGTEPTDATDLAVPDDYGYVLHALPIQLFSTLTLDTLRDNADNPGIVDMISGMLQTTLQNDLTDLGCNGISDANNNGFLTLAKGWIQVATDSANTIKTTISPGSQNHATLATGVVASNNALTWTARKAGEVGNGIMISLEDPGAIDQTLAITVTYTTTGVHIKASLATSHTGVITTTATLLKAAIAAAPEANALVSVANTGASTGAVAVAAVTSTYLTGGSTVGWIDSLATIRAASDPRYRPTSVFIMSLDDADAYTLELGKHVTGAPLIANADGAQFLRQPIIPCRYWPTGTVMYTPIKNLVMGLSTMVRRDSFYNTRKRALELTYDTACDYELGVKRACVLAATV